MCQELARRVLDVGFGFVLFARIGDIGFPLGSRDNGIVLLNNFVSIYRFSKRALEYTILNYVYNNK